MNKKNKKILVVEDETFLRQAVTEQLEKHGFDVIAALDGKKALFMIEKEQPDLVLLDLMLPKMPGEQVLKEMNENGLIEKIPVIVMTVKADEASSKNCLEVLKAADYVVKSELSLEELMGRVKKALKL